MQKGCFSLRLLNNFIKSEVSGHYHTPFSVSDFPFVYIINTDLILGGGEYVHTLCVLADVCVWGGVLLPGKGDSTDFSSIGYQGGKWRGI